MSPIASCFVLICAICLFCPSLGHNAGPGRGLFRMRRASFQQPHRIHATAVRKQSLSGGRVHRDVEEGSLAGKIRLEGPLGPDRHLHGYFGSMFSSGSGTSSYSGFSHGYNGYLSPAIPPASAPVTSSSERAEMLRSAFGSLLATRATSNA